MTDLTATLLFGLVLLAVVGLGEVLRSKAGWAPESSRRVVHALAGLLVVASPWLFEAPWGIAGLAAVFVLVNLYAVRRGLLPGMHGIRRRSLGTVTFPLALLFVLATCWAPDRAYILQVAFLVLALSDPLASLVGTRLRRPGRFRIAGHEKSVAGSTAFFLSAWALGAGALGVLNGHGLDGTGVVLAAFVVAALATGAEALARSGWDNLFVVVAIVVVLTWLHDRPGDAARLALAVGIAATFGGAAFAVRFLDLGGAVAAAGLGFSVLALGGWAWAVPGATFFVLSSVLSKLGRRRKAAAEALAEKGSRRDAGQVLANGGVAWALLAAYVFAPHDALYWGFVGSFAAAAADTWATEVGTLVGGPTWSVWGGRRVVPGTSGGVSAAGTLGALAGALTVTASVLPFAGAYAGAVGPGVAAGVALAGGFVASFVDSVIGATAQARYRDAATGAITERAGAGPLVRGRAWLTNDRVNGICSAVGALVPLAVFFLRGS